MEDQAAPKEKKGLVDRLRDLFRSSPPEKAAEELEKVLDQPPAPDQPAAGKTRRPVYKGVTF